MVLGTPVMWAVVYVKTSVCAFRSSCNFSLVFICSCLPIVIVYSRYWSFTTIFSSASTQLRISSLSACHALLAILFFFVSPCRLFLKGGFQFLLGSHDDEVQCFCDYEEAFSNRDFQGYFSQGLGVFPREANEWGLRVSSKGSDRWI
ncbi:hypothetical protein Tco_0868202 [Tanacetum coccineum]